MLFVVQNSIGKMSVLTKVPLKTRNLVGMLLRIILLKEEVKRVILVMVSALGVM